MGDFGKAMSLIWEASVLASKFSISRASFPFLARVFSFSLASFQFLASEFSVSR